MSSKICIVSTLAWPLRLHLGPHIKKLILLSQITLVGSKFFDVDNSYYSGKAKLIALNIERKIAPLADVLSLVRLILFFSKNEFVCVHTIMPKSGLLGMLAAKITGVPIRIHTFTGQVWCTRRGISRILLMYLDKVTASMATNVLTDSYTQKSVLVSNNIVPDIKIEVLHHGSIVGVNTNKFAPNSKTRLDIRRRLGINANELLFIYVGRLNRDKGMHNLFSAFRKLCEIIDNATLLLVGSDEDDCISEIHVNHLFINRKILHIAFSEEPESYMAASDVFCLPSYREGFSNVIIQSAAAGIPCVASRIGGIIDGVVEGETGLLHNINAVDEIYGAMLTLANNLKLRIQMGNQARDHVKKYFSEDVVVEKFIDYYDQIGVFAQK